jgi:aminopeptidase N
MFGKIAAFELRYQLKNPVFWVAAGMFFLLTFGSVTVENVQIGSTANVHVNSPFAIIQTHLILSLFFMFVSTAFVASVVVRDDETGFGPILRATRIRKFDYLFGRYLGAFLAAALAFLAVPLAMLLGSVMPWLDPEKVGPFRPGYYAFAYFVVALPTLFVTSAGFFALATATRSMMATYVGVIAFLVLYTIVVALAAKPEFMQTVAYLEPFGFGAFGLASRYWTAAERNSLLPALAGAMLWNRVLWTVAGFGFLALAYGIFRFEVRGKKARRRGKLREALGEPATTVAPPTLSGPRAAPRFDSRTAFAQGWARTRFDMSQVFRSPAFFVLLALGVLNSGGALWFADAGYGVPIYPVTRFMVSTLRGAFSIIPVIVCIYYAGELVWRERDRRTEEIIDSTPTPDWAFVAPKILAMALVLLSLLLVSVLTAVLVQTFKGYTAYEFGKYLWWYVVPSTLSLTLFAVLSLFIQTLVPNKFTGWGVMVLYFIVSLVMANVGLEDNLYHYGAGPLGPMTPLSDMNGQGWAEVAAWWFRAYWSAIALGLAVLAYALWRRGTEVKLRPRLVRLPRRLKSPAGALLGACVVAAVGLGAFIYINTHVWNPYRTQREDERWRADYEKALLKYENVPQPKILDVKLAVDLYPDQPAAVTRGVYVIENRTGAPIRELHVRFDRDLKVQGLSVEGARPIQTFDRFNYRIFGFDTPMAPGERRRVAFSTWQGQHGFRNSGNTTRINRNGAFLNNMELAPLIGMDRSMLLQDRVKRRKYGLVPELRAPKLEDDSARKFNYLRKDSDWVTSDIIVSTRADQIPMAPGYEVSDRVVGDRRVAEFRTEAPIMHFFSIQSARYAVRRETYKGVNLSVFYHPTHAWNIDRMIRALKVGLDYDQANFSPYQFRQVRILEFPAYAAFAQSFANTIPYSEDIGFIDDERDPTKIDMVTYVTAHELGHQWWAHQEISAYMQGDTMLVETLAQYSALMAMEKLYGPDQIRKFLKYELDSYLRSRGTEALEEMPLERVENQPYIHYRKGALVMYRLKDEIGEDAVNRALRTLLKNYAFKGAPYPASKDLVSYFRQEAGPDPKKQQLITDLFEKITLYDLKAVKASAKKRGDGRYDVTLQVSAKKVYASGKGAETATPMDETVDVGVFAAEPGKGRFNAKDVILFKRLPVRSGTQAFTFTVDRLPKFAGVDPYNKLIDRNSDDNVVKVAG